MSFHTFSAIQASLVKILGTALDARVTGALLVAIIYYPEKLKNVLPTDLQSWVSNPTVIKALAVILGIDILRKTNNKFSDLVLNNFKTVKFVPSEELVLITGGTSGLGLTMAKDFASKGVKVVAVDINPPNEELPTNIFFYKSDVTSPSKIAATAAEIRKDHGDPTVLINNAGVGSCLSILEGTETTIQKTFEVNTISHFWLAREFVPAMIKKDHGHVVTMASLAGYIVHAYNVDYACTKASAGAFHEGLHSELRNKYNAPHVRTTLVNPSWTKTPLIEPLYTNPEWKGHAMEPEEVTSAIVDQVVSGRGGHLILPKEFNPISTIRGWPSWLQYGFRNSISLELDRVKFSRIDK